MKKTRATEIRTLTVRNKIEDFKVVPIYCETAKMLADIGTKALSDRQFCYLRDLLTGYALVRLHHPTYPLPTYVLRKDQQNGG